MCPYLKHIACIGFLATAGCSGPSEKQENQSLPQPLTGSWTLLEYKPEESDTWQQYDDSIKYEKHLTDNHFVWFSYDTKNNRLLGMGGGTYSLKEDQYIEDIQFFYPPGSSELGQSIPFSLNLQDGIWMHTGYARVMEFDPETAEVIATDSSKIEEKWKRMELIPNADRELVGMWDLISYRESRDGNYIEYPDFVGYIKLITPTSFTWVYYNKDQDEIYAAGSGSYVYNDGAYAEAIKMMYPTNRGEIGTTVIFKTDLQHNKWKHQGVLSRVNATEEMNGTVIDSVWVDEIWTTHKETD